MKRTERIGAIIKILSDSPSKVYTLQYFCDLFNAAKSSISEDIHTANEALRAAGAGYLETMPGAKGGVKFVSDISSESLKELQNELCRKLSDPSRLLGGNFIYTSDIFCDSNLVNGIARAFAKRFKDCGADYVVTVETKGIPLAFAVSGLLNIPLVVIRREAKISEGSTVSINYFSGSSDRLQKMSMAKRAIQHDSKILVIDDFMRGGGSIVGVREMMHEFSCEVVGIGVAIVAITPQKKKVSDYSCICYLGEVSQSERRIEIFPNEEILKDFE